MYPATLLNSFIISSSLLVESLGFSIYRSCHLQIKTAVLLPFQFDAFISSSCLIALARTYCTMLNKRGESRNPCVVPDLKGNACSFLPLSMMVAYMAFSMFRCVPSNFILLRVLIINGCWSLSNAFSASIDMIMWFLSFILFMWRITFVHLWVLFQPHIPRINRTDHDIWSFWVIGISSFLIFYWGF